MLLLTFILAFCVVEHGLAFGDGFSAANTTASWPSPAFGSPPLTPSNQNAASGTKLPDPKATTTFGAGDDAGPLVMAYYPDWAGDQLSPEMIDFSLFDWIDFAFAIPNQSYGLTWDDPDSAPALLRRLVGAAHARGKRVKLSVGGWTGSKYFSSAVATSETRQHFVESIATAYNNFNLDGIDIDWEYPGRSGDAGNQVNPNDSENLLLFLQLLRDLLPPAAKLSAAVISAPFVDPNGHPMINTTEFAQVLDWVLVMNYDVWGSSGNPGPNAPLSDECESSSQPDANAVAAYKAWTTSGFPPHKLVLGLPAYGYISRSSADRLRTRRLEDVQKAPQNATEVVGDADGQVLFRQLIQQGVLSRIVNPQTGEVSYEGVQGFQRGWDLCSSTPFLRSTAAYQVVTYDDPVSLALKARFAREVGMLGINLFDAHGDTDSWDLTNAARRALVR